MRDVNEVLRQKEEELARVRQQVESLRIASPLLADAEPLVEPRHKQPGSETDNPADHDDSQATGTDGMFASASSRPRFWKKGK